MAWLIWFIPSYKIAKKAGYDWRMAICLTLPGFSLVTYWAFAFTEWPIERLVSNISQSDKNKQQEENI
ncbi:hypothetical protein FE394_10615 [Xenorhabdus sp. Reich]|uniref:Uncharacterized protein n=1 Tax=Xenorhabdus littoralis TaxID=2582835 RepID=A0ABU4SLW9_9GAMM|nr:hypothetical protein [Xenorhabdus sp. psl]MDX7999647.1 hypothetical protein [Xenorhabdus sp. Reich]